MVGGTRLSEEDTGTQKCDDGPGNGLAVNGDSLVEHPFLEKTDDTAEIHSSPRDVFRGAKGGPSGRVRQEWGKLRAKCGVHIPVHLSCTMEAG